MSIVNSPSRLLVIPEPSTAFHRRSKFSCSAHGRPERLQRPLLRSRPSLREPPSFEDSPVLVKSPDASQEDDRPREVGSAGEEPLSSEEGIRIQDHEQQVPELSRPVKKPRNGVAEDSEETQVQSQVPDEVPNGSALLKRPQMKPKMNPDPPSIKNDVLQAMSLLSRPEPPKVEFPNNITDQEASSEKLVESEVLAETVIQEEEEIDEVNQPIEATPPLRPTPPVQQTLIKPKPKPVTPTAPLDSTTIQKTTPSSVEDKDMELEREASEFKESFSVLKRPQMKPATSPDPPSIKNDVLQAMSLLSRPERPKVEFPNSIDNEEGLSEESVQNEHAEETVVQEEEELDEVNQPIEATPPLRPTPPVQQTLIKPQPVTPTPPLDSTAIQKTTPASVEDQDMKLEREASESKELFSVLKRPQMKPALHPDTPSAKEDDSVDAAFLLSKPERPKVKLPNNITDEGASSENIKENEVLAETVIQKEEEEEEIDEVNQPIEATPPLRLTPPVRQTLIKPKPKPVTPIPSLDSTTIQNRTPSSVEDQETELEKEVMGSEESQPMMERPKRPAMRSPMRPARPAPSPKVNPLVDLEQQFELLSPKPLNELQRPTFLQKPPVRPVQQKSGDADDESEVLATESSSSLKPYKKSSKDTVISPSSKLEVDESSSKLKIDNKASPELNLLVRDDPVADTVPNLVKPTRPVMPQMPSTEKQDEKQEVPIGRIVKDNVDQSVSKVVDLELPEDESLAEKAPSEAAFNVPELIERERNVEEQKSEQRDPQKLPEIKRPAPRRPTSRDTNTVSKSSLIDSIEKAPIRDPGFRPQDQVTKTESRDSQLLDSPQIPSRPRRPRTPDPVRPKMDPTPAQQSTPETISNELRATLQRTRSAKASASVRRDLPELRLDDPIQQQDAVIEGLESPVAKDRATPDLKEKPIKKTDSFDETDTLEIDRQFIREKHTQNAKQLELIRQKKEERQLKAEEDKQRKMEKRGQKISDPILIEMRRKARQERQEKRQSQIEATEKELIIEVGAEGMSVSDLAQLLAVDPTEVIKTLFIKGVMVTVNQTLDMDSVKVVANEMGVLVAEKTEGDVTEQAKKETDFLIDDEECISRPPVVTVMGHVDHGKTSLLDFIRNSKVASGEAGGITQAIGAYTCSVQTENEDRLICFLDTPGHEAFSAMRARGAKLTDIAIIIIAADDGIQPQTTEAINHAQAAEVPVIIAINKMDAPGAEPDRIKRQLSEIELLPEEWGGSTPVVCISAKTGEGVQDLLEMITLVSDIQLDLQANPHTSAKGTVVEAHLDKRAGVVCTLLVQNGALHVGDAVVSGGSYGKVRSLSNERGVQVSEAGPSIAVQMLGFNLLPSAGDIFEVCESESIARTQAQKQAQVLRQQYLAEASGGGSMVTLSSLASADDDEQGLQRFNIILKADTSGSLEAIRGALGKLPQDSVAIRYLHSAAGEVTESDVLLASNAEGVIFGFNVPISEQVASEAKQRGVQVKGYSVIYHLLDDVRSAMEGKLSPHEDRVWIGKAEVKAVFESGSRRVAGCRVLEGRLETGSFLQVLRKGRVVFEGSLSSLRKVKDSVQEVGVDQECGVGCDEFSEWKEQDLIEAYYLTEKQARLEDSQAAKAIDQEELQELIGS